jgi:O-antigen/teichoic acid export membrane protein
VSSPDTLRATPACASDCSQAAPGTLQWKETDRPKMNLAPASIVEGAAPELLPRIGSVPEIILTRRGLRHWGRQSAVSLLDQGLTSAASFGLNVLLVRWMAAEDYGAFAVAFAAYLFVSGFHNVLLIEPLSVMGPSKYAAQLSGYFRVQLGIHFLLVGVLSGVMLLVGILLSRAALRNSLPSAIVGSGLALPFFLLLWLARRMCYVAQRPGVAVLGSASHLCLLAMGMFLLHRFTQVSAFTSFLLVGLSSAVAACLVLLKLGLRKERSTSDFQVSWTEILRQNWSYGRWLTLTALLSWISIQVQVFSTASLLGLTSAGILRAMQLPSLVISQVVSATTLLVLPSLARELGQGNLARLHRKAALTSFFLTSVGVSFVVFLFFFSTQFEHLLYGSRYRAYAWLIPILGLTPVFTGFCSSFSYALRALGKSQYELLAYILSALTAAISSAVFLPLWGLRGAVASSVVTTAVLAFSVFSFYKRWGFRGNRPESLPAAAD